MGKKNIEIYAENDWRCIWCSLPFNQLNNSEMAHELNGKMLDALSVYETNREGIYANSIIDERENNSSEALIAHLNINSIQNKFEELKLLNEKLKSHVLIISETKLDNTYPDNQFILEGYRMYRRDRKKGGGGLIAYFSSCLPSRKILPKVYKTLEAIAIEAKIGKKAVLFLAEYRPPKQSNKRNHKEHSYYENVEQDINDIVMWASLKKQTVILLGDLNMDRLKSDRMVKFLEIWKRLITCNA